MKEQAKTYIEKLIATGEKEERSNFDYWEAAVCLAEETCTSLKTRMNGNYATSKLEVVGLLKLRAVEGCLELRELLPVTQKVGKKKPVKKVMPNTKEPVAPPLPKQAQLDPTLTQNACPWLEDYRRYSLESSPESFPAFHTFCGVMLLSALAARRVCIDQTDMIYPNMYMVLSGDSSIYAKSTAIGAMKRVLAELDLKELTFERSGMTSQKILSRMSRSIPKDWEALTDKAKEVVNKRLVFTGQKLCIYDEYGQLLKSAYREGSMHSGIRSLFLEALSCQIDVSSDTFNRGEEPVEQPYLGVLGACVAKDLTSVLKKGGAAWTDGLLPRTVFIAATGEPIIQTRKFKHLDIPDRVLSPLRLWHERLGVPVISIIEVVEEEKKKYCIEVAQPLVEHVLGIAEDADAAYTRYRETLKRMSGTAATKDFPHELIACYSRLAETALKMALLFASLESTDIQMKHYALAQELTEDMRTYLHTFYTEVTGQQMSVKRLLEDDILHALGQAKAISEATAQTQAILVRDSRPLKHYAKDEINKALAALKLAGTIGTKHTDKSIKYYLCEEEEQ